MSETQTVTIADFLLARIAEDEREARDAASRHQVEQGQGAFVCTEEGAHVGYSPEHVLAECEAKRRIVDAFTEDPWCIEGGYVYTEFALRALALPYADHPDYNPDWVS